MSRTKLSDKVSALLYAMLLEVGMQLMSAYLDSFISITTDIGTEVGVGDYEDADIYSLLPAWILSSQFEADGDDGDGPAVMQTAVGDGFLFKHVITVAGMLHIFSNASKDVYRCLQCWEHLYDALKILEKLVSHPGRLRNFVKLCVDPSPFSGASFNMLCPHLYDKRWVEVYDSCCYACVLFCCFHNVKPTGDVSFRHIVVFCRDLNHY